MNSNNYEFDALFNNAAIGIIIVNGSGNILLVNNFAENQFGYSAEELLGEKIEKLIPQRFREKHVHYRDNYHKHNPHSRPMGTGMDLFALKKNGDEFPVEVSLSTYKNAEGQFSIAFVSDITIRKRSEDALVQLNAELEQKVKDRTQSLEEALEKEKELNELKSRFVSMASHEFRTPLSTILSSIYLVSQYKEAEDQGKRDKHVQRIISSVNMLTDILNDFLSVGKIEEGKIQVRRQDINIDETVRAIATEINPILKPGQAIRYEHDGDVTVISDPGLLRHIMMNLVSNAIKFSPEGSSIWISTHVDKGKMTISIKDEGMGIPQDDQQYLFQRFFRGTNVTNIQGTGLGLHIVAKYVELLDGDINFESTPDKGTRFILTFNLNNE